VRRAPLGGRDGTQGLPVAAGAFGLAAALGWLIATAFFELLFGPQVQVVRSLALGSGIGVACGLSTGVLEWQAVREQVPDAGRIIPAAIASWTLAGVLAGLLLYYLSRSVDVYGPGVPLQGVVGATVVGLLGMSGQWVVVRSWAASEGGGRRWLLAVAAGATLGGACAIASSALLLAIAAPILPKEIWPYALIAASLTAAVVGGLVYGRCVGHGLRLISRREGAVEARPASSTPTTGPDAEPGL
jgi:hypothetical protein